MSKNYELKDDIVFEFPKGRTYVRSFDIINWDKGIDQVYFTVKSAVTDKNFVLQKTLGNGIVFIEEDKTDDGRTRRKFKLTIEATDTDDMNIDQDYVFDIAFTKMLNGKKVKQTAGLGTLTLIGTATHTHNERS